MLPSSNMYFASTPTVQQNFTDISLTSEHNSLSNEYKSFTMRVYEVNRLERQKYLEILTNIQKESNCNAATELTISAVSSSGKYKVPEISQHLLLISKQFYCEMYDLRLSIIQDLNSPFMNIISKHMLKMYCNNLRKICRKVNSSGRSAYLSNEAQCAINNSLASINSCERLIEDYSKKPASDSSEKALIAHIEGIKVYNFYYRQILESLHLTRR